MEYLDAKYLGMISFRLRNYKRKGGSLINFSCPFCGDSTKNKHKARGYVYEKEGSSYFHCHNCGLTLSIPSFLKKLDYSLYSEYTLERMKDAGKIKEEEPVLKMKKHIFEKNPFKSLKTINDLTKDDRVKQYVLARNLPEKYHGRLYSCPNTYSFVNTLIPNKFSDESLDFDETRLLIPYRNDKGVYHGFSARSLDPKSQVKYLRIVLDTDVPNIYGQDTVDLSQTTYVFEGEFDSMFIDNSLATGGGDLISSMYMFDKTNLVICYDNEPRSREMYKKINKAIIQGYAICIWPINLDYKDVNEMINAGYKPYDIKKCIDMNTYDGMKATLKLNDWTRI